MKKFYHKSECWTIRHYDVTEASRVTDPEESVSVKIILTLGNGRKVRITVTGYWPEAEGEWYKSAERIKFESEGMTILLVGYSYWTTEEYYKFADFIGSKYGVNEWAIRMILGDLVPDVEDLRERWWDHHVVGTYRLSRDGRKVYKV